MPQVRRVTRKPVAAGTRYAEDRMFIDRPAREDRYEYAVTACDDAGWESPRSHSVRADCRRAAAAEALRIVAPKPSAWAPPTFTSRPMNPQFSASMPT